MVNLNTTLLTNLIIAKPTLAEQTAIADKVDILDMTIRTEEVHHNKLELHKKGLMQDLLTGRIRVSAEEKIPSVARFLCKEIEE